MNEEAIEKRAKMILIIVRKHSSEHGHNAAKTRLTRLAQPYARSSQLSKPIGSLYEAGARTTCIWCG